MAKSYPIFDFPKTGIEAQLFYAGGAATEGGFTSGGARIVTPEPGGRAFLELQLSLQTKEWEIPFVSWLISKIANGAIFRVPLTKTPQLISDATLLDVFGIDGGVSWEGSLSWDNSKNWAGESFIETTAVSLEGSQIIKVNVSQTGEIIKYGHVIGFNDHSYLVDDIEYNGDGTANITVNPPIRNTIQVGDLMLFRPYFLGSVINASEFRTTYEKSNEGHIRPGRLLFAESLV